MVFSTWKFESFINLSWFPIFFSPTSDPRAQPASRSAYRRQRNYRVLRRGVPQGKSLAPSRSVENMHQIDCRWIQVYVYPKLKIFSVVLIADL